MRIICPTCASHYEVELEKIAAQGQLVRCARCRDVWLVRPDEDVAAVVEAPRAPAPRPAPVNVAPSEVVDFHAAKIRLRPRERQAAAARGRATSLSGLAAGALVLSSLAGLFAFRDAVVAHMPVAARVYAAIGAPVAREALALRDVRSTVIADGSERVLTLEGRIANLGDGPADVPGITVVVRSEGQAPLYTWTTAPPKPRLARGESIDFKTRLDSPPSGGRDVRVSFAPSTGRTVALLTP